LTYAAMFAAAEGALGRSSEWTQAAYDYMDPWRGQFFGNITYAGPTEAYMAAIAPLVGRGDDLDALVARTVELCDELDSPPTGMTARLWCACGLRIRGAPGDRARADELVAEAIEIGDHIGAGFARAAAANFPALRDEV
jgi:hypothetical protein